MAQYYEGYYMAQYYENDNLSEDEQKECINNKNQITLVNQEFNIEQITNDIMEKISDSREVPGCTNDLYKTWMRWIMV
jgi:hypothetical protein